MSHTTPAPPSRQLPAALPLPQTSYLICTTLRWYLGSLTALQSHSAVTQIRDQLYEIDRSPALTPSLLHVRMQYSRYCCQGLQELLCVEPLACTQQGDVPLSAYPRCRRSPPPDQPLRCPDPYPSLCPSHHARHWTLLEFQPAHT